MIQDVKKTIEDAGKRAYILSIGKINPAKIGNFQDIEVFVNIACPESTVNLMDHSSDYYHPIVTPFELDLALNSRDWTGKYSVEFSELVSKMKLDDPSDDRDADGEDEMYYSLISGSMKPKPRKVTHPSDNSESSSRDIQVVTHPRDLVLASSVTAASFNRREYRGLDPRIGQSEVQKAVDGLCGIAMAYEGENEK